MSESNLHSLKFPIGKLKLPQNISEEFLNDCIDTIRNFPKEIESLTKDLRIEQLNWRYRPDGWMVKQVVHHCCDGHVNAYIRYKWTLTEETPTIKAYDEKIWMELPDSVDDNISISLAFINALHFKWVNLLETMKPEDFEKCFIHPEHGRKVSLALNTAIYNWHCKHHLAHIKQAVECEGKYN